MYLFLALSLSILIVCRLSFSFYFCLFVLFDYWLFDHELFGHGKHWMFYIQSESMVHPYNWSKVSVKEEMWSIQQIPNIQTRLVIFIEAAMVVWKHFVVCIYPRHSNVVFLYPNFILFSPNFFMAQLCSPNCYFIFPYDDNDNFWQMQWPLLSQSSSSSSW